MLSRDEIQKAKAHLGKLLVLMKSMEETATQSQTSAIETQPEATDEAENESQSQSTFDLETMLKDKETARFRGQRRGTNTSVAENILDAYIKLPRLSLTTNILEHWESQKNSNLVLYILSQVALSIPATQVSVERLFSSLKFILSAQRAQLAQQKLTNVMFIRANKQFNSFEM